MPVTWILVLLVWRYGSRSPRTKRRLTITCIIIALLFSNKWLYDQANLCWQPAPVSIEEVAPHETAILLTGMINFDKKDRGFFGTSSDRFIQTNRLYQSGKVKRILITGGSGSLTHTSPSEAIFLQQMFIESGVPEAAILAEPFSRNTYENALYSKRMIDSLQLQGPFLLVTSAQHLRRAEAVFRKMGIPFTSFPSDYQVINNRFSIDEHLIPSPRALGSWSLLIKEIVGYWVYKLTGKA